MVKAELKSLTWMMCEAFGLDTRIDKYQGKRPIGLYRWDMEVLIDVLSDALNDRDQYTDTSAPEFETANKLLRRLNDEYRKAFDN